VTNHVEVTGTFSSACLGKGNDEVVSAQADANVTCSSTACVETSALCSPAAACPGAPVTVTGSAKNCGIGPETIVITIEGQQQSFPDVPAGQTVSWQRTVPMKECTAGQQVQYDVSATASSDCGQVGPVPASCTVECKNPSVQIDKSAEATVDAGGTIHYTITVTNPAASTTDLENVIVTDELCPEVSNPTNFGGTCNTGAPQVSGSTITWPAFSLASGGSCTLTFEATAAGAGGTCTVDLTCHNVVNVTAQCGNATARSSASADTNIPCVQPGLCRLTGGGCLNENGDNKGHKQSTFGGNSSPAHDGGGPTGNSWEHVYRDGKTILFNWHSWDAHVIQCSVVPPGPCHPAAENTRADFVGTGKYSIGAGGREEDGNQVAYIIDHREGACNKSNRDEYGIIVRKGLVIGEGDIVFQTSGEIDCGNLQIHETPAKIFGSGTSLPANETGTVGVALLNRPYPNPFSGTTNFAYKVAEGGASVDVGVYNVAGRLVKTLASGAQGAGTYTVTWDGSDAAGVRMAPGVYFLKSRVGGDSSVSRVIYVSR
jgi:uncharacterized repeat protein (TIGR01451 family)